MISVKDSQPYIQHGYTLHYIGFCTHNDMCISLYVSPNSDKKRFQTEAISAISFDITSMTLTDITSVTFRRLGSLKAVVGSIVTLVLSFSVQISSRLHSPSQKHFDYFAQGGHSMSPVLNYIGSVLSSSISLNRNLFLRLQSFFC